MQVENFFYEVHSLRDLFSKNLPENILDFLIILYVNFKSLV